MRQEYRYVGGEKTEGNGPAIVSLWTGHGRIYSLLMKPLQALRVTFSTEDVASTEREAGNIHFLSFSL